MKAFAELYAALDQTTKTNAKVDALKRYLSAAQPEDAAWAVNFLIGRRPKRLLESRKLAQWAIEEAGVPDWLFSDCYHVVGDFAETIALLLPPADASSQLPLHYWIEERLLQSLRFAPSLSGAGLPFDPVLGAAIRGAISRLFR